MLELVWSFSVTTFTPEGTESEDPATPSQEGVTPAGRLATLRVIGAVSPLRRLTVTV